jgi:2-hydroxychromene-2-carboxylate isomerase
MDYPLHERCRQGRYTQNREIRAMAIHVEYFFAPQSPWTYLGHGRLAELLDRCGATVEVMPVDLGRIFPISGGLPLGKRAPQRQAYRLVELRRFSQFLSLPMNVQPRHFPVAGDPAARLITAVGQARGEADAMRITAAVLAACWARDLDIADSAALAQLLQGCALPADLLAASGTDAAQARYEQATQRAIDAGVFGAPTYCVQGELFWGQDRLDFLARRLGCA